MRAGTGRNAHAGWLGGQVSSGHDAVCIQHRFGGGGGGRCSAQGESTGRRPHPPHPNKAGAGPLQASPLVARAAASVRLGGLGWLGKGCTWVRCGRGSSAVLRLPATAATAALAAAASALLVRYCARVR